MVKAIAKEIGSETARMTVLVSKEKAKEGAQLVELTSAEVAVSEIVFTEDDLDHAEQQIYA